MTAPHSWQPIDLAALGNEPPPVASISGLTYPGSLSLFYGEPEAVKTWLALVLSLEEIRAGRPVVWIDFEMSPRSIHARLLDLSATENELESFRYLQPSEPLKGKEIEVDIAALLETVKPSLVVVDAMAGALALHGLDGNSNADVETFYAVTLAPFRVSGAAVIVIDHVTKDRETRGRWPIGAQRKLGAVDVGLSVEMVKALARGETGLAKLHVRKDRLGALHRPYAAEIELTSDADTGRIAWEIRQAQHTDDESGDTWKPTVLMERVFAYLKEQPGPVTRNSIAASVKGTKQYVLQAIDYLIAEGAAEENPGPHNSKLVSLAVCGSEPVPEPHEPQTRGTAPVPVLLSIPNSNSNRTKTDRGEALESALGPVSEDALEAEKWQAGGNDDIPF